MSFQRISIKEAKSLIEKDDLILIDIRDYTILSDKKLETSNRNIEKYSGDAPYFNEHIRKELEKI